MARTKSVLVGLLLALAAPLAPAAPPSSTPNLGTELAHSLSKLMLVTYTCQTYLGGLSQYRLAKLHAIEVDTAASGDKNHAVLQIDKVEQQIKATNADKRMVAKFDKMKLSYADRVGTCNDLVAEAQDKVQHLEAQLGMLK